MIDCAAAAPAAAFTIVQLLDAIEAEVEKLVGTVGRVEKVDAKLMLGALPF